MYVKLVKSINSTDCININFLIVILYYSYARCFVLFLIHMNLRLPQKNFFEKQLRLDM